VYIFSSIGRRFFYIFSLIFLFSFGTITFFANGYWVDEMRFYRYNLLFNPNNFILQRNYISALMSGNLLDEAESQAKRMVFYNPRYCVSYYCLGEVYLKKGKFKEAREQFNNALTIDQLYIPALLGRNKVDWLLGEYNLPDDCYSLATYQLCAECFLRKADIDSAISVCKKALAVKPSAGVLAITGKIFLKKEMLSSAIQAFEEALRLEPDNIEAKERLLDCYKLLNRDKERDLLIQQKTQH